MTAIQRTRHIDRDPDAVRRLFDGPIRTWLPVMVGPDEDSWRASTREGPVRIRVEVHAGTVWVLPDGTHRRRFRVEPDRTSFANLFTAMLTPTVEGDLSIQSPDDADSGVELVFHGQTHRRSVLTGPLERLVIGDPFTRSGIDTLLHEIADRLRRTEPVPDAAGPTSGRTSCLLPRTRAGRP